MPSTLQSSFATGEMAPEYYGRSDLGAVYQHGLKRARNFHVLPQGGATRRPGYMRVADTKNGTVTFARLVKMIPASNTVYVLEFGPGYIRVYRRRAQVKAGGVAYEITTTYVAGEVQQLSFTAYQKQLWIWHANHPPAILQWGGADTSWTLADAGFTDGPYLDPVQNAATLTPSAAGSNTATVTASAITAINGGAGFQAGDVGRLIRLYQATLSLIDINSITTGGSLYAAGDVIKAHAGAGQPVYGLAGATQDAYITVTGVGAGGAVTSARVTIPGQYLIAPSGSFTQDLTSGNGSGFTASVTYGAGSNFLWSWGKITSRSSTTVIGVALQASVMAADGTTQNLVFISTTPITNWRLGAWGGQEGYPAVGGATFQERLLCGATLNYPKRVFGSALPLPGTSVANFLSMAPSLAVAGQVVDSNAVVFDIDDPQGDPICWISPAGNAETAQIGIGTGHAEHIVQPGSQAQAFSPLSLQTYPVSSYSSMALPPLRVGRFLLFFDRSAKRLREWMYLWSAGGFIGPEASPYGRHLTLPGAAAMDYALSPHPTVWMCLQDGSLAGLSYMPEQSVSTTPKENISAWHSHQLGGAYYGGAPFVESLVCVPDENGGDDQVWLVATRADALGTTKTIEVSTPYFRSQPLDQAVFVDSAISTALTYPNASCTPGLATSFVPSGQPLPQRGDSITFGFGVIAVAAANDAVTGAVLRINGGTFLVQSAAGDGTAVTCLCVDPPKTLQPQPPGSWSYTRMLTSFSGFDVFNGRSVMVYADGQPQGTQTVSAGTIILAAPASYVTAGYPYSSILETLDIDFPVPDGSSQIKTGSIDHLYLRVFETIGGSYGPGPGRLDAIEPRRDDDLPQWAPRLRGAVSALPGVDDDDEDHDGDLRVAFPGGSSTHRRIRIEQDQPWPMTVLALLARGGTGELSPK